MEMVGETPDIDNLPNRPLEYYGMLLVGETPDLSNLPRRHLEYYLMLLVGEVPDLSNLPCRPLEYYLMLLVGETPDLNKLPLRPLVYYLQLWSEIGTSDIFFRIDSSGDLVGVSKVGLESQFGMVGGNLQYSGSAGQFNSAAINSSGYLIGA